MAWDRTIEEQKVRRDHEDNMTRLAAQMEATLTVRCPQYNPMVRQVRIGSRPQFLLQLTIASVSKGGATDTALYWMRRAVTACKGLAPLPLGRLEVEVAPDGES